MCEPSFGSDVALIFLKIQEAIEKGHMDCVEVLLQIEDSWSSWPGSLDEALVKATQKGQFGLVKYLFRLEPSWFLGDLQRPLCEAMSGGYIHIMKFLVASAANAEGLTPLALATIKEDENMVKSVLQAGADVNRISQQTGQTALMEAALNGCRKIAILLIEAGAGVNIVDKAGHTALMLAARKRNWRMEEVLIKAGADVDKLCAEDFTALLHCALEGNEEGVKMLVYAATDMNRPCLKGQTALSHCASTGNEKGVRMLVAVGADVNIAGASGDTALMEAARNEHLNIMEALMEAGADVNRICANNNTVLLQLALKGNEQGVRLLLRSGAKVNINIRFFPAVKENIRVLLVAAGQLMETYREYPLDRFTLHDWCRSAIRSRLMLLDIHENLFLRIPRLGLPSRLTKYLLYNASLDENDT